MVRPAVHLPAAAVTVLPAAHLPVAAATGLPVAHLPGVAGDRRRARRQGLPATVLPAGRLPALRRLPATVRPAAHPAVVDCPPVTFRQESRPEVHPDMDLRVVRLPVVDLLVVDMGRLPARPEATVLPGALLPEVATAARPATVRPVAARPVASYRLSTLHPAWAVAARAVAPR